MPIKDNLTGIPHHAAKQLASQDFRNGAKPISISIKEVPIEAHNSVGNGERAHTMFRQSYQIFDKHMKSGSRERKIQMAFKACNDTAGANRLCLRYIVYGIFPRINKDSPPSPSINEKIEVMKKTTKDRKK